MNIHVPIPKISDYIRSASLLILQSCLKHEGKNQEIQVIKKYGDISECECYAGQLNQVFMNILNNVTDALRRLKVKLITSD